MHQVSYADLALWRCNLNFAISSRLHNRVKPSTVSAGYRGIPHNGNLAITECSCGFQRNPKQITENLAVTDSVSFSGNFDVFPCIKGKKTIKY